MKKGRIFIAVILLLFIAAGCSTVEQAPPEPTSAPAELSVSDLNDILSTLDLASASLTCHGEAKESYPADAAICAESYREELKDFPWEAYSPPSELDENDAEFYRLSAPNTVITTFPGRCDSSYPIHLVTDDGEGWFVLPQAEVDTATQTGATIYTIFSSWYSEARTASLCGENGIPLMAEELLYFRQYTESIWTEYDAEWDGYRSGSTEISCFFTSFYDDVRKLNFDDSMRYFPGDRNNPAQTTDAESEALTHVEGWPFTEPDKMPVPIHKYPRSRVDAVLLKYAGITTAELDTTGVAYLAEYDAFYTYTSDFGPGTFIPYYGEKTENIVRLWDIPAEYDGSTNESKCLTLQKSGEDWRILSYQATVIS